jgi:hypothetical protein
MPARTRSQDARRKLDLDYEDEIDEKAGDGPTSTFFSPRKKSKTGETSATTSDLVTPQKKTKAKNIVTPGLDAEGEEPRRQDAKRQAKKGPTKAEPTYVPTHLYKNVDYSSGDIENLSEGEKRAFKLVAQHFIIPSDFEQSSRRFGPYSGTCYEERVLAAYQVDQLEPIDAEAGALEICVSCGNEGHKKRDCSDIL